MSAATRQRVAVVTGGAGGIGASIAESLGREGWYVVTLDPLVTLDGTEQLAELEDSTVARIVAAGGSARASNASVTDAVAVRVLFEELVSERGGLDAVVNVAGITRQSYFARGTEEDWVVLLNVHLGGWLNVLEAALPLMAEAGHGRILAARQLGLAQVPTIRLEHLSQAQAKAFMIADNRLTENSVWDPRVGICWQPRSAVASPARAAILLSPTISKIPR